MDQKLNVLGDKTRLEIIKQINLQQKERKCSSICACHILEALDCSQSTLSHHLKLLTDNKILKREKRGKYCYYEINKQTLNELISFLEKLKGNEIETSN